MRRAAVIAWLVLGAAPSAHAHGPCDCLTPERGAPGTRVTAEYSVYKVVFNPDRTDLGIGPESLWKRHRPGAPVTVLRRPWRYSPTPLNRGGTFTIPDVAPGRYLVAMYDGGEGGAHYSWETFRVLPGAAKAATPREAVENGNGVPAMAAVGIALVALAFGVLLGRRARRRPA